MNTLDNFVLNIAINKEPFTKKWQSASANGEYDILPGVIIPHTVTKKNLKEVELKISRETMRNIKKNTLEISKMVLKNEDKLKSGDLYARVTCYMAPIVRNGVTNMFTPYINDVELVASSEEDKPKVVAALTKGEPENTFGEIPSL